MTDVIAISWFCVYAACVISFTINWDFHSAPVKYGTYTSLPAPTYALYLQFGLTKYTSRRWNKILI